MLSWDELQSVVRAATTRFQQVAAKHSDRGEPAPYLGFAPFIGEGYTSIDSRPEQILREFPHMIVDSDAKTQALEILARNGSEQPTVGPMPDQDHKQLENALHLLTYRNDIYIEIRVDCPDIEPCRWQSGDDDDLWETEPTGTAGSRRKLRWVTIAGIQQDLQESGKWEAPLLGL